MELQDLANAVEKGKVKIVKQLTQEALDQGFSAQDILNSMIGAMGIVGDNFRDNKIFVPEMLVAAKAMSAGTAILEPIMAGAGVEPMGTVVIGTVRADLHDIGKNLVTMMVKGVGATVYDLGVDVPDATFVEKAEEYQADIVILSALLTTTMPMLNDVIQEFVKQGVRDKYYIMVGGAPVNQEYADEIGADAYTADAGSCAEHVKKVLAEMKAKKG